MAEVIENTGMSDRMAKWDLKYNSPYVRDLMDRTRATAVKNASTAFALLADAELRTKQFLNYYPISCIQIAPYLCYARQVWKNQQTKHGELLRCKVGELVTTWSSRGLDEELLWTLAANVFDIPRYTQLPT
jgi:hypothetical protein